MVKKLSSVSSLSTVWGLCRFSPGEVKKMEWRKRERWQPKLTKPLDQSLIPSLVSLSLPLSLTHRRRQTWMELKGMWNLWHIRTQNHPQMIYKRQGPDWGAVLTVTTCSVKSPVRAGSTVTVTGQRLFFCFYLLDHVFLRERQTLH